MEGQAGHACGLRLGDLVSPMLFTLVIEVLNSLITQAVARGVLQRLTTRHAASSISLYDDDVVVFCHPDSSNLNAIREILRVFGELLGRAPTSLSASRSQSAALQVIKLPQLKS